MDLDTNNLFPEINPNIDEIVEKEQMLDGDEVVKDEDMDYTAPKKTHKDIFMSNKKQNIKMNIKEPTDTETENDIIRPTLKRQQTVNKKDRYAHLAKARQKGIETRRRKAEEKRKIKEAEKLKKLEAKNLRRQATMERNRENARKRYYKQKENKKNVAEKIVEDTKLTPIQKTTINPDGMSFNTFAKYMMKYENMKDAYNKQKQKSKPQPIPKKEKPKQSYHPPNYPLSYLAPHNRYREFTGF